jgi:hypothetical protein
VLCVVANFLPEVREFIKHNITTPFPRTGYAAS